MGRVLRVSWDDSEPTPIAEAAEVLRAGGVAVVPTDTVYGVAQSVAANPDGAIGLFALKRRPHDKAIPWLVADADALDAYGSDVPAYAHALARRLWPGGLTLVVRAGDAVPPAYRGAGDTIALRMPASAPVVALVRALGCPLATTSANTSGQPARDAFAALEPRIVEEAAVALDDGQPAHGTAASTVVLCTDSHAPVIARAGAIPAELVMEIAAAAKTSR